MKLATRRLAVMVFMVTFSLLFLAAGQAQADNSLKIQVICPATVTPEIPFNLTIKAYNFTSSSITFNRVVVAYANPDLTIRGPYVVSSATTTVPKRISESEPTLKTFSVPLKIMTTQPSGTLVPILVTLWYNQYTAGYARGAGAGAAKIK